jgi:hypothetical protein
MDFHYDIRGSCFFFLPIGLPNQTLFITAFSIPHATIWPDQAGQLRIPLKISRLKPPGRAAEFSLTEKLAVSLVRVRLVLVVVGIQFLFVWLLLISDV